MSRRARERLDCSLRRRSAALLDLADAGIASRLEAQLTTVKSALLDEVAAQARRRGVRVLRASGSEFEASLSFAGLN
jgi:hypothetical protein